MGEVVRLDSVNALKKQIKACYDRAQKAEAEMKSWRQRTGALLIELKERTNHGEWLPTLKEMEIPERTAREWMEIVQTPGTHEKIKERHRVKRIKNKTAGAPAVLTKSKSIVLPPGVYSDKSKKGRYAVKLPNEDPFFEGEMPSDEERVFNSLSNLFGEVCARRAWLDKLFGKKWLKFKFPSELQTLVTEAEAEMKTLISIIKGEKS